MRCDPRSGVVRLRDRGKTLRVTFSFRALLYNEDTICHLPAWLCQKPAWSCRARAKIDQHGAILAQGTVTAAHDSALHTQCMLTTANADGGTQPSTPPYY